jgi:Aspartyl protease
MIASAQSAEEVLGKARVAMAAHGLGHAHILLSEGTESTTGLIGTDTRADDLDSGRFADHTAFKLFAEGEVYDGTTHWRQDRSGGVHALNGEFSIAYDRSTGWLVRRAYLRAGAEEATLGPVSLQKDGGSTFLTFTATPKNGTPMELWFNQSTFTLARVFRQEPIHASYQRFSDYRAVKGLLLPYTIESGEVGDADVDVVKVSRYTFAEKPRVDAFTRPAAPPDTELHAVSSVPALIKGYVVIPARLNDQPELHFILDTGGHDILTPDALKRLGLSAVGEGHSGGAGEGKVTEQSVVVKKLEIGDAVMRDQYFAVIDLFPSAVKSGMQGLPDGIIGLELFERLGVRVDYAKSEVTLLPTAALPATCKGTPAVISFNDDMPLTEGTLDGQRGLIAIDTGNAASTVIQGVWASRNGMAAQLKLGRAISSYGTGGESKNWISSGHALSIQDTKVSNQDFRYAEDKKGSFSSRTEAANAGHDLLQGYIVTFDYARSQMCLEASPDSTPAK